MAEPPKSPADPRPGEEPYYIDNECLNCGGNLVPFEYAIEQGWHDEFECVECDGLYIDFPSEADLEEYNE